MRKSLLFLIACMVSIRVLGSGVQVSEYLKHKEEPFMISYVWGVSSGILTAVAINEDYGGNKLFCIPPSVIITNEESVGILENELSILSKGGMSTNESLISVVFLLAMERLYPCTN